MILITKGLLLFRPSNNFQPSCAKQFLVCIGWTHDFVADWRYGTQLKMLNFDVASINLWSTTTNSSKGLKRKHSICWPLYLQKTNEQKNMNDWLVVSTHLKNSSQNWKSFPQIGVKIKNVWNHHLVNDHCWICFPILCIYLPTPRIPGFPSSKSVLGGFRDVWFLGAVGWTQTIRVFI